MLSDLQDKFVLEKAPSCQKSAAEIGFMIIMSRIKHIGLLQKRREERKTAFEENVLTVVIALF